MLAMMMIIIKMMVMMMTMMMMIIINKTTTSSDNGDNNGKRFSISYNINNNNVDLPDHGHHSYRPLDVFVHDVGVRH